MNAFGLTRYLGPSKVRGLDSNQRPLGPEPSVLPLNYPGMCAIRWRSIDTPSTINVRELNRDHTLRASLYPLESGAPF